MKKYGEFILEKKSKQMYLFLDVDGVLTPKLANKEDEYKAKFHPEAVKYLRKLLDKFDLKIIISSSWRNDKSFKWIKNRFEEDDIKIHDITPNHQKHKRSKQIQMWLDDNGKNYESFAIIDDEHPDIGKLFPDNFVKVDGKVGFVKDYYYNKVKQILNKNQ
jgi:histidinol phosphatase-like enzyme